MAVLLEQSPDQYNAAYIPNVYVLDSLGAADKYVLSIYIGGVIVATFKQNENQEGLAIFDVQKVLQSYLELQTQNSSAGFLAETEEATQTPTVALTYQARYGSDTAGVITYDGYAPTKYVFNVYDNWRNIDWDEVPFMPEPSAVPCEVGSAVNASYIYTYNYLTNWPLTGTITINSNTGIRQPVRSDDWRTLSFMNRIGNFNDGTDWGVNLAPYMVTIDFYRPNGTIASQIYYALSNAQGLNVRTDCNDLTPTYPNDDYLVATIGSGPENLKAAGYWPSGDVAHYDVRVLSANACQWDIGGNIGDCTALDFFDDYWGDPIFEAQYYISDECTKFDPIQIAFMNQYGVLDYTTWDRRNTKTVNTQRNNYYKLLGTWNSDAFSIDPQGRGQTNFSSQIVTEVTASSYWMEDAESKWLQELFTSPQVYIYIDGQWEPVVISTQTYDEKTIAREKMFRYSITFTYSNNKKIQRG